MLLLARSATGVGAWLVPQTPTRIRVQTCRCISTPPVTAPRSAIEPCRARKFIKLRCAELSGLVGVLGVAIAIASSECGGRACDDSGHQSHRDLGRHGHFLLVSESKFPLQTRSGRATFIPRLALK